jgi:hypothetical protein
VRFVRRSLRCSVTELIVRSKVLRVIALVAVALMMSSSPARAQTAPAPHPSATPVLPKVPLHGEVFVETNKLGQVSRITSIKPSQDKGFNTEIYGNAAQAFIRTPNGDAVPGLYRLSYDYDPATKKLRRSVDLVKSGGVNPEAPGMVTVLKKNLDAQQKQAQQRAAQAQSQSQTPSKLPDFDKITSPTPSH